MTKKNCWFNRRNASDNSLNLKNRNLTWVYGVAGYLRQRKMTSNDLRRTINAPTWADFSLLLQIKKTWLKMITTPNAVQLNGSFHQYLEMKKCLHVRTRSRPKKAGKWSDACAQQPITVLNEWTGFLSVLKQQRHQFQEMRQNRGIFVWIKKNKDFINPARLGLFLGASAGWGGGGGGGGRKVPAAHNSNSIHGIEI